MNGELTCERIEASYRRRKPMDSGAFPRPEFERPSCDPAWTVWFTVDGMPDMFQLFFDQEPPFKVGSTYAFEINETPTMTAMAVPAQEPAP